MKAGEPTYSVAQTNPRAHAQVPIRSLLDRERHSTGAMSIARSLTASLALAGTATALQYLAPVQDINLPSSESAKEPLQWLGANGPYHAGRQRLPSVRLCR